MFAINRRNLALAAVLLGVLSLSTVPNFYVSIVTAQPALVAEAVAGRQKLLTQVSTVDGDLLRTKLQELGRGNHANKNLAHWYAGEVNHDGQWLSLDELQNEIANDPRLIEYRQKRLTASNSATDHVKLAHWCKKKGLADQAKVHWLYILQLQPKHRAALNELELQWYQGQLIAKDEIVRVQAREREFKKQKKLWKTKARNLRQALEHGQPAERDSARNEIRQIQQPAAVPALLEEFAEKGKTEAKTTQRQTDLINALGGIDDPVALETLLQFALGSPRATVRYTALNQLKSRAFHEYVPMLLAELQMPIEASVSINEIGNNIVNTYNYEQEGPGEKFYETSKQSYRTIPGYRKRVDPVYRTRHIPPKLIREAYDIPERYHPESVSSCGGGYVPAHYHRARHVPDQYSSARTESEHVGYYYTDNPQFYINRKINAQRSMAEAGQLTRQVQLANQVIMQQNESVVALLAEVTGETLDTYPKSWWNWWSDYLDHHPDVATLGARQQMNTVLLNQEQRGLARGTWVWTIEGRRAIETVLPGDYVLSQNPSTGELAFKVVLVTKALPEMSISQLDFASGALHCASGHVIWATGAGWRRVNKMRPGEAFHSVYDEPQLERIGAAFTIDSYDLIVDDYHTFFAGDQGVLVHDSIPISPTYEALPGFSAADVADAARQASLAVTK